MRLRQMILASEPNTLLGSLQELTKTLGVGTVTMQQASRILEHEGMLEVRRGPGGGYFGTRPDAAALGRAISQFLLAHASNDHEAVDIVSLLDCELMANAAAEGNDDLRKELKQLATTIDKRDTPEKRVSFENEFHHIIFRMVKRPLTELLARVTMRTYSARTHVTFYPDAEDFEAWKLQRHNIVYAILKRDPEMARFEAMRRRTYLMQKLQAR